MITHAFHPLKGQRLTVLFSQRKRTGLFFVCEVEGGDGSPWLRSGPTAACPPQLVA
ncbi:hypothetical protein IW249_004463 [Micromonospora vinacea]|uniref:Uncharacterized protein n=1 Tax=Micromonospora vinacea TaxID=709878 RepID=A0ABS0K7T6_9ACTN|nr:hypothetical protein [Micromonospora vinacea]